jgi:hypothetical protein
MSLKPYYYLTDARNRRFDLSDPTISESERIVLYPKPSESEMSRNTQLIPRSKAHGSVNRGDQFISQKSFSLNFDIIASKITFFRQKMNALESFMATFPPIKLHWEPFGLESVVITSPIKPRFRSGTNNQIATASIDFIQPEVFWIKKEPIVIEESGLTTGSIFDVNVEDDFRGVPITAHDAAPIIEIEALGANSDFLIRNNTNLDIMRIQEPSFSAASTSGKIIIDCRNGNITYKNAAKKTILTAGFPIQLISGINQIYYQGDSSVNLKFIYQPRFWH